MYSIYAGDELLYSDVYPNESRKVTSPTLKMAVDEAGSLEFTVSEKNKCYTKLQRMKTIITVKKNEVPIWDGRILREDRDINKNKKIYIEGALAFLNDTCQPLKEYGNKSLENLVTAILTEHYNATNKDASRAIYWGGCAGTFNPPQIEYWITKYEYTIDTIKSLAEYLECHFIIKKDANDGYKNKIYFFKDAFEYSNQSIVFTKNLLDYTENYDLSKLATVLLPLAQTDRESADKPINIGTTVDLTTPKPCGEDGWGVFCPLSRGWIQGWDRNKTNRVVNKGCNFLYKGGYPGNYTRNDISIDIANNVSVGYVNSSGNVVIDYSSSHKTFVTDILEVNSKYQVEPGVNWWTEESFAAYQFAIEESFNPYCRAKDIEAYLYYKTANDTSWTLFKPAGEDAKSGYGLWNDNSSLTQPQIWDRDPARLAFKPGYYDDGPDCGSYTWGIRLCFGLSTDDSEHDTDATSFKSRLKIAKLYGIYGIEHNEGQHGRPTDWKDESGSYTNYTITGSNSGVETARGIYNAKVLNLKQNQNGSVEPWAFSRYPLAESVTTQIAIDNNVITRTRLLPTVYSNDKIFTGDFDIRPRLSYSYSGIEVNDILRFTRNPVENPKDKTIRDFGITDTNDIVSGLAALQNLNYGWLKYHPNATASVSAQPCIAVMEIDLDKYSSYYLSTRNDTYDRESAERPCVASVWKIKESVQDDWIWFDGRDGDADPGCEYHLMDRVNREDGSVDDYLARPFVSISAGRSLPDSSSTHDDLTYDSNHNFKILNPDKYEFESCDIVTTRCYETEMKFTYVPEEGYSHHILLVLYCDSDEISVTMATDEEKYSILAIGQDSEGMSLDKEIKERHGPAPSHTYDQTKKNDVYDDKLGYGTLVPPTSEHRLMNLSEYLATPNPFPNVYEEGGYYGDSVSEPFDLTADGVVKRVSSLERSDSSSFKVCSIIVKPSYVNDNGEKCPQSLYISTTMMGKSGMYAIFELSDSNNRAKNWTESWTPKCRAIEYGKYINGLTTYNKKKITLPYCDDKNTLLEVLVASYDSDPHIWLHDPELSNKASYLTIASVNNGEIRLYGDDSNVFTSAIEEGSLNDQNGSINLFSDDTRCRTKDFVEFSQSVAYGFRCSSTGVQARVYVYDSDENFQYVTDWGSSNSVIFVSGVIQGYKAKVEFRKTNGTDIIKPSNIVEAQLYPLNQSVMSKLTQGLLTYVQRSEYRYNLLTTEPADWATNYTDYYTKSGSDYIPVTGETAPTFATDTYYERETIPNIEIEADPNQGNSGIYVSTSDYFVTDSTDTINMYVSPNVLPTKITPEGSSEEKDVVDAQYFLKVMYQYPTDYNNETIYDTTPYSTSESLGMLTFAPNAKNIRFKVQIRVSVAYLDNGEKVFVNAPITPETISAITLSILHEKEYTPPNKAYQTYGRIEKRIEFEDVESSQELLERARKYMNQSQFDEMTLKVKALDMTVMGANVDSLEVADKINVTSPPHGLYKDFIIRQLSLPFDKPDNASFELGFDNKDSLAKLIRKEKSKW